MQKYIDKLNQLIDLTQEDKVTEINNSFQKTGTPDEVLKHVQNTFEELNYVKMALQTAIDRINNLPDFLNQQ